MKYRLTYFPFGGRAEPIRVAFHIAGIEFEDRRIPGPEFAACRARGEFPLGSVPVLDIDGVAFVQSIAQLRYVANLVPDSGLYPIDPYAALLVDSVIDTLNDTLGNGLSPSMKASDPDEKAKLRQVFLQTVVPKCFGYTEELLGRVEGPFLTGDTLTIGDIVIGLTALLYSSGYLDGVSAEVLEPYPRIRALADAYMAHPAIKAYVAATD